MEEILADTVDQTVFENENMYRQIIEYSVDPIVIHRNYKILYINQSGTRFFKGLKEEIVGTCVLDVFQEEDKPIIMERNRQAMAGTEPLDVIEETITKFDGTKVEVELYCHPVIFGDKKAIQTVFRDVTVRKDTEKLLNHQEKLASIGQIAAGIAHEIKNPLTSVKGFLRLLKESYTHPYLDVMDAELEKALDTLKNLLQVSKPDLQEEKVVSINFCKELSSLMLLFQERLYNVEVELDLRDSEITIFGKKNLFLKAFFNLIKNALEAIEEKGKITILHYHKDGWIHIKVSDTGVGVPKDKLKMLGTPFFSSKSDGTGLGLTQVFTTINEHGGNITVESVVGQGTTFHIQLPVKQ
ncbi:ATP-binding protein [Domibacillus epiphyticus]|uniref:histidine kinase n=1 Tax=Domibacillus epiphyticus TaxID=1714355 RepID=A0A1V2AAB3_9BACI|nr:ATP-binding protein [Domibacillus epiphyticus]OMP67772.1 PAS domain-containing sensor histidine kinase [Domibacillus epiphyticus]